MILMKERKKQSAAEQSVPNPAKLFEGNPGFLGGLSNESELARSCPEEFKKQNPWSEYADKIFYMGGSIKNWEWKTDDQDVRKKQIECFKGLLGTFGLRTEDKSAVAGWMLSEMLKEVPEYVGHPEEGAGKRSRKDNKKADKPSRKKKK
jgi:hypothetical protein